MNPMDMLKEKGMERAMKSLDVGEHPLVKAVATIIATLENDQAHAVARCIDAGGLDLPLHHDLEERREQLFDVAEAVANDDLERLWFEDLADIEKPSTALNYVGLDGDEWREQLRTWYAKYYEMDVVDKPLSAADPEDVGNVAAMHVENQYGVTLQEFVAGVVNWEQREALEHLLAGNIQANTEVMHRTADRLLELQEENERLQERVDELEEQLDDADD